MSDYKRHDYTVHISSETRYYAPCSGCDNCHGDDDPITDEAKMRRDLKHYGWVVIDGDLYCNDCKEAKEGGPCEDCGKPGTWGHCPFAYDVHGDESPRCLCEDCRADRAGDI